MSKSNLFIDDNKMDLFIYVEELNNGMWRWGIGDKKKNVVTVSINMWEREEDAKINASYWTEKLGLSISGYWR